MATKPNTAWDSPSMVRVLELGKYVTGTPAIRMVEQCGLPTEAANLDKIVILDNACGTGTLTGFLHDGDLLDESAKSKLEVTCADYAQNMVDYVKSKIDKYHWKNTTAIVADAMDTKLPSSHYTHVFFAFGPFVLKHPLQGIQECLRMLQPNGKFGATSWKYVPWIEEFRPVFQGEFKDLYWPSGVSFMRTFTENEEPWDDPEYVKQSLKDSGFEDVEVTVHEHQTKFTMEETEASLTGILAMVKQRMWSQEQRDKHSAGVDNAIVKMLKGKYPNGTVTWDWRAIVATGRKPA